jgi:hypothetical protein
MCVHYQGQGRCTAFPTRIPLPIFAGDVDHMIVRPGQTGDDVFELMDFQAWQETGERRPAAAQPSPAASAVGRAAVSGLTVRVRRQA